MPIVEAKCPNCGAKLSVDNEKDAAVCEFCGTPYIVEKAIAGAISNSTINNSVINVYNNDENKQEKELSDEELYARYLAEYKAIKKDIRKSKLKHFLAGVILAVICAILFIIGLALDKENKAALWLLIGGGMGAPAFFIAGLQSLIRTTESDARRFRKLNDAYENAHLKKKFK